MTYEKLFISKASGVVTVGNIIADKLKEIYKLEKVEVVSNLPIKRDVDGEEISLHKALNIPVDKK